MTFSIAHGGAIYFHQNMALIAQHQFFLLIRHLPQTHNYAMTTLKLNLVEQTEFSMFALRPKRLVSSGYRQNHLQTKPTPQHPYIHFETLCGMKAKVRVLSIAELQQA